MAYSVLVTHIHTRPFPNADKLLLADCSGEQIIVGINTVDNALGLYFSSDGQLGTEFAQTMDLCRRKDSEGNPAGGMLEENRRVKCIKLRGERSEGLFISLDELSKQGYIVDSLKQGDEITQLVCKGKVQTIAQKYETPATIRARQQSAKLGIKRKVREVIFHEHVDTDQYSRNAHRVKNCHVVLTVKLHGTSTRYTNALVTEEIPRKGISKCIAKLLKKPTNTKTWMPLVGTRHVILWNDKEVTNSYYKEDSNIYKRHGVVLELRKNETVYGELVGYLPSGAAVMGVQSTKDLKDKEVQKRFGDSMVYSYGCEQGQSKLFVYRITTQNEDGIVHEMSWLQVKKRCAELGVNHVPVVWEGYVEDEGHISYDFVRQTILEHDDNRKPSVLDPRHCEEGLVIRTDGIDGTHFFKSKTILFKLLESIIKEDPNYVDTEESA